MSCLLCMEGAKLCEISPGRQPVGKDPCRVVCTAQAEHDLSKWWRRLPFSALFSCLSVCCIRRPFVAGKQTDPLFRAARLGACLSTAVRDELHIHLETCCPSSAESPALVWIANPGLCASRAPAATVEGGQSQSSTRHKLACMRMGRDRIWGRLPVRECIQMYYEGHTAPPRQLAE